MTTPFTMEEMSNLKWVAVDLDDTLAEGSWAPGETDFRIGEPIETNIAKLEKVVTAGYKIAIYTARPYSHYQLIETWAKEKIPQIPIRAIVCGKLLFRWFIDDKAVNVTTESWLPQ